MLSISFGSPMWASDPSVLMSLVVLGGFASTWIVSKTFDWIARGLEAVLPDVDRRA